MTCVHNNEDFWNQKVLHSSYNSFRLSILTCSGIIIVIFFSFCPSFLAHSYEWTIVTGIFRQKIKKGTFPLLGILNLMSSSWHPTTNLETTNPDLSIYCCFLSRKNRYFGFFLILKQHILLKKSQFVDSRLVVECHKLIISPIWFSMPSGKSQKVFSYLTPPFEK